MRECHNIEISVIGIILFRLFRLQSIHDSKDRGSLQHFIEELNDIEGKL